MRNWAWGLLVGGSLLVGCATGNGTPIRPNPSPGLPRLTPVTPQPVTVTVAKAPSATPSATPTPTIALTPSAACGQLLPVALPGDPATPGPPFNLTILEGAMPAEAQPAVERLLAAPDTVALAAYRVGREAEGVYWRADAPMPLASVVKLVHLVAYANALESGVVDAGQQVKLTDLARFYLPRSDLSAHTAALAELAADQQLADGTLPLSAVVWMMMRYSDNASADYLQALLGQTTIEQTVRDLELQPHSAPCPFLGRFLLMSNHTRIGDDGPAVTALVADPARYSREVAYLTDVYSQDAAFRQAEQAYWGTQRRPSVAVQRQFVAWLDTRGAARAYADLMARIISDELGSPRVHNVVRYYLEWPLEVFAANRERFLAIGYKNGALPGVLTTVYYAWPVGSAEPVVVALFYRDLPLSTYQRWRRTLPDDALAHWLLSDPQAIPRLRQWLSLTP